MTLPAWKTVLGTDVPFDPAYHQTARAEIASFFSEPPGVVLDIGCGGGGTGKLLKTKFPGTRVIGIELNAQAAQHAREVLDDVICERIEDVRLADHVGDVQIDTVLLLDVLEHLYDPWRALLRVHEWLAPGTRVLASVPNVRNLGTLDALAGGRWDYDVNGVLDVTHLRFFTRATLRELFEQTGFEVVALEPLLQVAALDRLVLGRGPSRLTTANLTIGYRSRADLEDLYALQYVVDARVGDRGIATATRSPVA
ncbi:MAG: class I SAM-dependent methyltransferase [Casimicrobiaceae bacterium]